MSYGLDRKVPIAAFLLLFFCICLIPAATASLNWLTEANAGLDFTTCNYCGYSLNYPSPLQNVTNSSSYSKCLLAGGSVFTPVAFDVDGDTYDEIITGTTSTLYVHNRDCALIDTITLAKTLKGAPMVTNSDNDAEFDLVVGSNKGVSVYEWSSIQNEFILQYYIGDTVSSYGSFSCPFLSNRCLGFQSGSGSNGVAVFDMVNRSYYTGTAGLSKQVNDNTRPGISYLKTPVAGSYIYKVPYCFLSTTLNDINCGIWNENGNLSGTYVIEPFSNPTVTDNINTYYAKMGGGTYMFTYYRVSYIGGSPNLYYEGVEISETTTYTEMYHAGVTHILNSTYGKFYSNWAVGDFDKDGENEACYLYGGEYEIAGSYANKYNKTFLKCLDSSLNVILDEDVTGVADINNLVMGDFKPDNEYLGFATYEGLFYYDGGNLNMLMNASSGKSYGYPIIYLDGTAGAPIVIFTDDTRGFIIKAAEIAVSCGNGICDVYENAFNCIEDCNFNETATATNEYANGTAPSGTWVGFNATICASGYAEYGKCSLKNGGMRCTINSECLSGTCANGKCNSPGAWSSIDNFVDQSFGADSVSKMFIAILLIFGLAGGIVWASAGHIAGIVLALGSMFTSTIFFLIVGWLPAFFAIGLVLLIIIVVAVLLVLK